MIKKMKRVLAVFLVMVSAVTYVMVPTLADDTTTELGIEVTYGQTEARTIYDMVNDFRTSDETWYWNSSNTEKVYVETGELLYDYQLEKVAMQRAAELAVYYSHSRPNGVHRDVLCTEYGLTYQAGENIGAGHTSAQQIFDDWLEEDDDYSGQGHRRNMLGAYTSIALGHVTHNGIEYWVMLLGLGYSGAAETPANDSTVNATVQVNADQFAQVSASGSITLTAGESKNISPINLNVRLTETWPSYKNFNVAADVAWTPDNASIATVTGGTVTGVAAGNTSLTGNYMGHTVTLPVTVQKNPNAVNTQVKDFVYRLYEVILGRTPSSVEAQDWVNRLMSGTHTGSDVVAGFVLSPEYTRKNTSDSDYVDMLYRAMFGRNPDAGGKQDWMDCLDDGLTRQYVLAGFTNSQEFNRLCNNYGIVMGQWTSNDVRDRNPEITAFVTRLYRTCLNRNPDEGGLIDWVTLLATGEYGGADVVRGFVFSAEMNRKNLSNNDYVETLYRALFDRNSDATGKRTWMDCLSRGWSRDQVLSGFTGSAEFNRLCSRYGIRV